MRLCGCIFSHHQEIARYTFWGPMLLDYLDHENSKNVTKHGDYLSTVNPIPVSTIYEFPYVISRILAVGRPGRCRIYPIAANGINDRSVIAPPDRRTP